MSDDDVCAECGCSRTVKVPEGTGNFNRTASRHVGGEQVKMVDACADCGEREFVAQVCYEADQDEPSSEADMDSLHAIAQELCGPSGGEA